MGRQVGNASNCITLYLDIGRHHLPDEGRQSAELDNGNFVFVCQGLVTDNRQAGRKERLTIDGQIA